MAGGDAAGKTRRLRELLTLRAAPQLDDNDVPLRTYRSVRALLCLLRNVSTLCAVVSIATDSVPWFNACFQFISLWLTGGVAEFLVTLDCSSGGDAAWRGGGCRGGAWRIVRA